MNAPAEIVIIDKITRSEIVIFEFTDNTPNKEMAIIKINPTMDINARKADHLILFATLGSERSLKRPSFIVVVNFFVKVILLNIPITGAPNISAPKASTTNNNRISREQTPSENLSFQCSGKLINHSNSYAVRLVYLHHLLPFGSHRDQAHRNTCQYADARQVISALPWAGRPCGGRG